MNTQATFKIEDFVTIETHFGVPEHVIRADTRNRCSEDLVAMLQETARILYPDSDFEIYLLPSQPGSYTDIVKFVRKHNVGTAIGAVATVGTLTLGYLNYRDSHEDHLHAQEMQVVDDATKCLTLQKDLEDARKNYDIEAVLQEKILEVCGNLNLKKKKNDMYNTLQGDNMIKDNETILKDSESKTIFSKIIARQDFSKYIEPIIDQKYSLESVDGVVELISPVFKQKKEGKGIAWRGTYYGEDVLFGSIPVLKNGEDLDFYMQDADFKDQTNNRQVVFASGDNMKISFDIRGEFKEGSILNRSIYIKEVKSHNEDIISHKERVARKSRDIQDEGQNSLFHIS